MALLAATLVGAEFLARREAVAKISSAISCYLGDTAQITLGPTPVLWQYVTGTFERITIHTAGNQIKQAQQMKVDATLTDVTAADPASVGGVDATVDWPTAGITATARQVLGAAGSLVRIGTHSQGGTISLELTTGLGLGNLRVEAAPKVRDGKITVDITNLPSTIPIPGITPEEIQSTLDTVATRLGGDYPLGAIADSVLVTDAGVQAHFHTDSPAVLSHTSASNCANT